MFSGPREPIGRFGERSSEMTRVQFEGRENGGSVPESRVSSSVTLKHQVLESGAGERERVKLCLLCLILARVCQRRTAGSEDACEVVWRPLNGPEPFARLVEPGSPSSFQNSLSLSPARSTVVTLRRVV